MKCKICGQTSRSLPAMAEHYRKKHPTHMKRSAGRVKHPKNNKKRYCSECGRPL